MRAAPELSEQNARALGWKAVSLISGAAAGMAAERIMSAVWKLVAPTPPPPDDADRSIPWAQAVAWGAAVGVGAGVARVVAHRSAAVAWEAATSEPPPVAST
jgi:hypothetical protein